MKKYHVSPDHVIRHYDVTGKICPNPYAYNEGKNTWETFQKGISEKNADHEPKTQTPEVWYRVRKTWKNADSQVGAFKTLKQAKQCANQYVGYRVYNTSGKKVYVSAKLPYRVQVKTGSIPVRKGPTKTCRSMKQISKGTFEITEEKNGFDFCVTSPVRKCSGRIKNIYIFFKKDYYKREILFEITKKGCVYRIRL